MYMSNFDQNKINQEIINNQYNILNNDLHSSHNLINKENFNDKLQKLNKIKSF